MIGRALELGHSQPVSGTARRSERSLVLAVGPRDPAIGVPSFRTAISGVCPERSLRS